MNPRCGATSYCLHRLRPRIHNPTREVLWYTSQAGGYLGNARPARTSSLRITQRQHLDGSQTTGTQASTSLFWTRNKWIVSCPSTRAIIMDGSTWAKFYSLPISSVMIWWNYEAGMRQAEVIFLAKKITLWLRRKIPCMDGPWFLVCSGRGLRINYLNSACCAKSCLHLQCAPS